LSSWYGDDLAWIHHTGYRDFAEAIAPWLIGILPRGLIIDIGCGSGVLARELTSAGFDVLGIDVSPSMIALARETAPRARFEVGSFATADIPPCAAIVATGEVLNYGDLRTFIRRVRTNLLIFDIAERGSYPAHSEHRAGGDDWSVISIKDSDGVHLMRRVLTFRNIGGEIRRSEEVHELELYDQDEVEALLREAGFTVRTRRSYGRYRLPEGHKLYIARWRGID
jgi:SAM-dependent methyltransferase